jgi:hypothetical protein
MEYLVEFEVNLPDGTPESELNGRDNAEAFACPRLIPGFRNGVCSISHASSSTSMSLT